MKYPFQQLSTTNSRYSEELKRVSADIIDSGWYLNGPYTAAFERELAATVGTTHAIGTGNGLDALKLIMRGYMELGRVNPGAPFVAAGNTFIATLLPASELGLEIVLKDPDITTHCLDLRQIVDQLPDESGIIAVTHLYGTPSWDEEAALAIKNRGWIIIEDNAQAIGARWHTRPAGSLGDASAISFYPAKNIGGLGDAGAVCTSDDKLAQTVRELHNYGGSKQYHYQYKGYNSRIDELQAGMLSIKLKDLENMCHRRNEVAQAYHDHIKHPEVTVPDFIPHTRQVWHQYVVRCNRRDSLAEWLRENGVGTLIHYPVPPHRQKCYSELSRTPLPVTEQLAATVLSIPIANITPQEAKEIAGIINSFPN